MRRSTISLRLNGLRRNAGAFGMNTISSPNEPGWRKRSVSRCGFVYCVMLIFVMLESGTRCSMPPRRTSRYSRASSTESARFQISLRNKAAPSTSISVGMNTKNNPGGDTGAAGMLSRATERLQRDGSGPAKPKPTMPNQRTGNTRFMKNVCPEEMRSMSSPSPQSSVKLSSMPLPAGSRKKTCRCDRSGASSTTYGIAAASSVARIAASSSQRNAT